MTDQKRNKDIEEHHIRTMIELRDAERVIDKIYTLFTIIKRNGKKRLS